MSFRNISSRQEYKVLRTRPKIPSDEKMWQKIYPPQVALTFKSVQQFAVANWIPIVIGIVALIGGAAGGFFLGQKYATVDVAKKFTEGAIDLLPKSVKKGLEQHAGKYIDLF